MAADCRLQHYGYSRSVIGDLAPLHVGLRQSSQAVAIAIARSQTLRSPLNACGNPARLPRSPLLACNVHDRRRYSMLRLVPRQVDLDQLLLRGAVLRALRGLVGGGA